MAQADVPAGADTQQAESGAARIRLADTGMQFFQRVADVTETVLPPFDRVIAIFHGELGETAQDAIHLLRPNGIQPVGARGSGRKTDRVETQFGGQMPENPRDIGYARGQRDARADRVGTMTL